MKTMLAVMVGTGFFALGFAGCATQTKAPVATTVAAVATEPTTSAAPQTDEAGEIAVEDELVAPEESAPLALEPPPFREGQLAPTSPVAAKRVPAAKPTAQAAPASTTLAQFRSWVARDNGMTQQQRLRRIERDWLGRLATLPREDRTAAASLIDQLDCSARLIGQRSRLVERLRDDARPLAAR